MLARQAQSLTEMLSLENDAVIDAVSLARSLEEIASTCVNDERLLTSNPWRVESAPLPQELGQ